MLCFLVFLSLSLTVCKGYQQATKATATCSKERDTCPVVPTKSDSDVILLSKESTFTLRSIDQVCNSPILRIGLLHK